MAAGSSSRCGFDKLAAELNQQTVLQQCLQTFLECDSIDDIWVVGKNVPVSGKIKGFIGGGSSRFESVKAGLKHCAGYYKDDVRIIVHNAANPYLSRADLATGITLAETKQNLIFGFFSPNSIKQVGTDGRISQFLNREEIFETQTPQISTLHTFKKALEAFKIRTQSSNTHTEFELKALEPRDEAELLALINEPIHVYECDPSNIKITFASDFTIPENQRLGIGEDSHRFASKFIPAKPFCLGGIDISGGALSSDGNSDGDVILHALCNALLSAYGDKTFDPIAAPICKTGDTNSVSYLNATIAHLKRQSTDLNIHQVLISLEGAQPRIAPEHEAIVNNLATLLKLDPLQIGLTYTTGEALTECGQGLGIRGTVLVTLQA